MEIKKYITSDAPGFLSSSTVKKKEDKENFAKRTSLCAHHNKRKWQFLRKLPSKNSLFLCIEKVTALQGPSFFVQESNLLLDDSLFQNIYNMAQT